MRQEIKAAITIIANITNYSKKCFRVQRRSMYHSSLHYDHFSIWLFTSENVYKIVALHSYFVR